MDIAAFIRPEREEAPAEDSVPAACTARGAARVEQLTRALDLLERDVLWPFFEPVERVRVVNNRAISTQDIVDTLWREALAP